MSGKLLVIILLLTAVLGGGGMYYLQVYAYYVEVELTPGRDVMLLSAATGDAAPIRYSDFQAIDATSSPIRYRACFTTDQPLDDLLSDFVVADGATPLVAPAWFGCFQAADIGAALEAGTAAAFLAAKNISYGVDRVVAITDDGRGFVWHQLNQCGKKAYDGTVVGEECPPLPASQ